MSGARFLRLARRLRDERSGVMMLEFAFSLPIVLGVMMYAVELSNLALSNLRVSQAALNLADNASRVGLDSTLSTQQLRELDVNDVLQATRVQTQGWKLTQRGRVILSSLEDNSGTQRIHWQRCLGLKSGPGYDSTYGGTKVTDGTDNTANTQGTLAPTGMGEAGRKVMAPTNSGVMFVEVNYDYNPVVSSRWLPGGSEKLHYVASFVVRDRRDFSQIFNPSPTATRSTCDKYTA